jgi:hypothetical protein
MRRKETFWPGVGALVVGSAAAWWWRRRSATSRSGLEPTQPVQVSPERAALHRAQRPILTAAASRVLGREASLAEVQYLHAIAVLESNYARGWKGAMVRSNNYGAIQCPATKVSGTEASFARAEGRITPSGSCIEYVDSRADGTRYSVSFRAYDTPEDGAADLARHVFSVRPGVVRALQSAVPSCFRASLAMRREKYYEGFCPTATKEHGADAARQSFKSPERDAGTAACEREAVAAHARRCASIIAEVAHSADDAERVALGDFDDALAWWRQGK